MPYCLPTSSIRQFCRSTFLRGAWLTLGIRLVLPLTGLVLTLGTTSSPVRASNAASAPPQLKDILSRIDAAATGRNLPQVMQFYATGFSNSDGLDRQELEKALTRLWQDYPRLTYRTELVSWQQDGDKTIAETITRIEGVRQFEGQTYRLRAQLRARQQIRDRQILQQDILTEQTQLLLGASPPTVTVKLPEKVTVGQQFSFDAVVQEPLGNDFLLGAVTEEAVRPTNYFNLAPSKLEPLAAGGIFKIGRAPQEKADRWISAILVRQGGITVVTQRLRVVER